MIVTIKKYIITIIEQNHKLALTYLRSIQAVVAEWLRRLTRNQIPYGSVGSNPTGCGKVLQNSI